MAVAVLEVGAQVGDGVLGEGARDAGQGVAEGVRGEAEDVGQVGVVGEALEDGGGLVAPVGGRAGGDAVGGDVADVDRLGTAGGEARAGGLVGVEGGVGDGEAGGERVQQAVGEPGGLR